MLSEKYVEEKDSTKIYLQVENPEDNESEIDIVNVAVNMMKKRRLYKYLFAVAVCAGVLIGLLMIGIGQMTGEKSYAQAVVTFQFDGIDKGLDPNGASFDVNKIKSPVIIEEALASTGITDIDAEKIRQNIMIEGIIPEDAVERLTVIKEMALEDVSNYEKIHDVTYFPSQYVVSLYQFKGMSASESTEILNAILDSYNEYFMDTYANTAVLTVTNNLIDYSEYDYLEAADMVGSQIDIMINYVNERRAQAPDFRSSNTGLSFGDIATSLNTIKSVDLSKLNSYVESTTLTKDKARMVEYYNYRIKNYNMELSQLQVELTTIQNTIDGYIKDPVVILSSQESTTELTQTNEYYDQLIEKKLSLSNQIASTNSKLNKTYELLNSLNSASRSFTQAEFNYADTLLEKIANTISEWVILIEQTTDEYYSTTLFSNAVKVAVPAQYQAAGGLVSMAKNIIIGVAAMVFVVFAVWCVDGLKTELSAMRRKKKAAKA